MIQLDIGNIYSYVRFKVGTPISKQEEVIKYLRDNLKYPNDVWSTHTNEHIRQYNYLLTPKGRFVTGLIGFVTGLLKAADLEYIIEDNQDPIDPPDEASIIRRLKRLEYKLRPYQLDAVFAGIETRRGMFDMATGAGKSLVMAGLLAVWDLKSIIIVDSADLARQLRDDISFIIGESVGMIGSGVWEEERVTVAMVQTLTASKAASKKGKAIRNFLREIELIVFDEVHHAQARTWRDASAMCSGAVLRYGMSGTCFSSEITIENGQRVTSKDGLLIAHTGPVIYKVRADELIEMGYLSKPKVLMIQNRVYSDSTKMSPADEYTRIIMKDEYRNDVASQMTNEAYKSGGQTIIFVNRIDHGHIIKEKLIKLGVNPADVEFISGQDDKSYRKQKIAEFKSGSLPIIIGTVLGEGLNFYPTLGINLGAGQTKKDVIQRLGRVLRKPPSSSGDADTSVVSHVTFVDFMDDGHKWYEKHGKARLATYIEQGHEVVPTHYIEGHLLQSTTEKLEIKGENLQNIYKTFMDVYRELVGTWAWATGQKPRVKKLFVTLTEALNIRENDRYEEALDSFAEYLRRGTKAWLSWDKSTPANYIGFLANKKSVDMYAAKKLVSPDTEIAGTEGDNYWEW